jgi:DNA invertase Pin-like site-specific DNA recombinase
MRVSTLDQHPETQEHDLRQLARQRGWQVVAVYTDQGISGTRARRPALDRLLADAHRGRLDLVACWACDRLARSTRHFLEVLDQLRHLNVAFVSYREQIDTAGPLGRAVMTIVGAVAELERSLIVERVRAGLRRAKLEGRRIGRTPLAVDVNQIARHRALGYSLSRIAQLHGISKTSVGRILHRGGGGPKGCAQQPLQAAETTGPPQAA